MIIKCKKKCKKIKIDKSLKQYVNQQRWFSDERERSSYFPLERITVADRNRKTELNCEWRKKVKVIRRGWG